VCGTYNGMNDGKGGSVYVGPALQKSHREKRGRKWALHCLAFQEARRGLNTGKMSTDSGDGRH
jgi:hypothetical protein